LVIPSKNAERGHGKRFPRNSKILDETRKFIKQSNYYNKILNAMATQLDSITAKLGENSNHYPLESSKLTKIS